MKGIILAGGTGTRLYPATKALSKHLLPVYDKPMIYYPLSTLMLAGIRDVLIISTPDSIGIYKKLLEDGSKWGISLEYAVQEKPEGIAQAFIIAEKFINNDTCSLILGDNIFYGHNLEKYLIPSTEITEGGHIFVYPVNNPQRYGVVSFNEKKEITHIEEKPQNPVSNYAITGLYFYDSTVIDIAKNLKPSERGELEITDINKEYLKERKLKARPLERGYLWLDAGTPESLIDSSYLIKTLEHRQGLKVACLEEIAYRKGYITKEDLEKIASEHQNHYGDYLRYLLKL
jgi:glucose-1-phosphate thymidylyltransferase